jgi:hypothetical protein
VGKLDVYVADPLFDCPKRRSCGLFGQLVVDLVGFDCESGQGIEDNARRTSENQQRNRQKDRN